MKGKWKKSLLDFWIFLQEEFKKMQEDEEKERKNLQTEMHGWAEAGSEAGIVGTDPTKNLETSSD